MKRELRHEKTLRLAINGLGVAPKVKVILHSIVAEVEGAHRDDALATDAEVKRLRSLLEDALDYWESETCPHEDLSRGGVIWTICDACGDRWADDRGGFKPNPALTRIEEFRAALKPLNPRPKPYICTCGDEQCQGQCTERRKRRTSVGR